MLEISQHNKKKLCNYLLTDLPTTNLGRPTYVYVGKLLFCIN